MVWSSRNPLATLVAVWVLGIIGSAPAAAAVWYPNGDTETAARTYMQPGEVLMTRPTSNSDHPVPLDVSECENVDVGLVADENGNGTGATSFTAELDWCPKSLIDTANDTNTQRGNGCVAASNGTLTGSGTLQGFGSPSGNIWIQVGGTFAADPLISARCNGPR